MFYSSPWLQNCRFCKILPPMPKCAYLQIWMQKLPKIVVFMANFQFSNIVLHICFPFLSEMWYLCKSIHICKPECRNCPKLWYLWLTLNFQLLFCIFVCLFSGSTKMLIFRFGFDFISTKKSKQNQNLVLRN